MRSSRRAPKALLGQLRFAAPDATAVGAVTASVAAVLGDADDPARSSLAIVDLAAARTRGAGCLGGTMVTSRPLLPQPPRQARLSTGAVLSMRAGSLMVACVASVILG